MSAPATSGLVASGAGLFTSDELDRIELLGGQMPLMEAPMGSGKPDPNKRITQVAGLVHNDQTQWIYLRIAHAVSAVNKNFKLDLSTYREAIQFMVYHADQGSHFNWHVDQGPTVNRQLSLTLQLTDPELYQGCELQFNNGTEIWSASKERGTLIAFPSYLQHRVTPITAGTRKALVAWIAGP